jgi:hypothetical protein
LRHSSQLTTRVLVGSIGAVFLAVAEEPTLNAVAITASEETILTERLVGDQQRLHLALLVLQLAVLHRVLPIAGLLLDIEVQAGRTANGLETLNRRRRKRLAAGSIVSSEAPIKLLECIFESKIQFRIEEAIRGISGDLISIKAKANISHDSPMRCTE